MTKWLKETDYYRRVLMDQSEYKIHVEERVYNTGLIDLLKGQTHVCGIFLLEGDIHYYDQTYRRYSLLWIDQGTNLIVNVDHSFKILFMETEMPLKEGALHLQVFDDDALSWSRPLEEGVTASKHMVKPEDYGVKIQTCIYTHNFVHEWHTHTAAHGFYVLEGMLEYDFEGEGVSYYGPGEFVASKPGDEIMHVQAPDASYCKYLFIGDGPFDFIVNGVNLYGQ